MKPLPSYRDDEADRFELETVRKMFTISQEDVLNAGAEWRTARERKNRW